MLTVALLLPHAIPAGPRSSSRSLAPSHGVAASSTAFDAFCDVTNGKGCWPSSFLIGMEKAGTTAVAIALTRSPLFQLGAVAPSNDTATLSVAKTLGTNADVKEPHAFDDFFANEGTSSSTDLYTRLFRRADDASSPTPSFLDATPTYFSNPAAPALLAARMPSQLLAKARFVVILREPVASALNLFNHMRASAESVRDPEHVRSYCFKHAQRKTNTNDGKVTFDDVARCELAAANENNLSGKWGQYVDGLRAWSQHVSRKQLLVVSHASLLREPKRAMRSIVSHYGGSTQSPSYNEALKVEQYDTKYVSDDVVEAVQCETLAALRFHFLKPNAELYKKLASDRADRLAPSLEEPFPEFKVQVPCSDREISTRERKWLDKRTHAAPLEHRAESDDAMLERLDVLKHMQPEREILFGVITGGGMEERYGSVAKTWCGSQLAACVYFSNETTRATTSTPAVTIDIVQDLIDRSGYPTWSLRSEDDWPIYRSAQLRFLPALNWLRERMLADPAKNPTTHKYFGAAKWLLLVDDDTFVFYYTLQQHLRSLDHNSPIYTGLVSPSEWIPTNLTYDGPGEVGRDGYVNSYDLFVNGGSGSIFSRAGLKALDTRDCIREMRPDGSWWQFQSDWALGACAKRAGISPLEAPRGLFNQFICVDKHNHPFYCETYEQRERRQATGGLLSWDMNAHGRNDLDAPLKQPATIHPIKTVGGFEYLWEHFASSAHQPTHNVSALRSAINVAILVASGAGNDTRLTTVDALRLGATSAPRAHRRGTI